MNTWQIWLEDLFLQGTVKITVFGTYDSTGYGIEAEVRFMPYGYKEDGWSREGRGNSYAEAMEAVWANEAKGGML